MTTTGALFQHGLHDVGNATHEPPPQGFDRRQLRTMVREGRKGIARVVIQTIIDEEFDAARARLALGGRPVEELGHTGDYTPDPDSLDVVLAMCADRSIGPAQEKTAELLVAYRPELLVVCGIAGGIAGRTGFRGQPIQAGDVVVADFLHDVSFRKITEGRDSLRHYAFDQPSNGLLLHARALARDFDLAAATTQACAPPDGQQPPCKLHVGPIVVFDAVLGDPRHPEQRRAVERVDNALALDMESVGIGRAVHSARTAVDYNPRLLVVRGISDMIEVADEHETPDEAAEKEDRNDRQRQHWKPFAAAVAACVAGTIVERFLAQPDPRVRSAGQPTTPSAP